MTTQLTFLKYVDRFAGRFLASIFPRPMAGRIPSDPKSALFIRPGGIGDAALLLPTLEELKARFPKVTIDVLAERRNAGVFALCPVVRMAYRYDIPSELLSVIRTRYDVVVDTEQWHRLSAVVARVVRTSARIGFSTNGRSRLFSHSVPYEQDDYESESFMHLLIPLGAGEKINYPFIRVSDRDAENAGGLLPPMNGRPFVAIFPGASITERRWGSDRFALLADRLVKRGIGVVAVGGATDREEGLSIESVGGISLCGLTDLGGTAGVIARSSLLISGDSGILHIGVGLGVPTVSLFGPGRALKWAPRGDNHIVINKCLPCSPCTTFGYTPKCPIIACCMSEITVDEVEEAVLTLLARKKCGARQ